MATNDEPAPIRRIEWLWTCGHQAGSICVHCYIELARRAHELASEVDRLRDARDEERGR